MIPDTKRIKLCRKFELLFPSTVFLTACCQCVINDSSNPLLTPHLYHSFHLSHPDQVSGSVVNFSFQCINSMSFLKSPWRSSFCFSITLFFAKLSCICHQNDNTSMNYSTDNFSLILKTQQSRKIIASCFSNFIEVNSLWEENKNKSYWKWVFFA